MAFFLLLLPFLLSLELLLFLMERERKTTGTRGTIRTEEYHDKEREREREIKSENERERTRERERERERTPRERYINKHSKLNIQTITLTYLTTAFPAGTI